MNAAGSPRDLLRSWLDRRAAPEALEWLDLAAGRIADGAAERDINLAVSLAPHRFGNADLELGEADIADADAARPGWRPGDWTASQAARLVLVLSIGEAARMAATVEQLCLTADLAELIAFYRGLPLYPEPARYLARAREGVRSNMKAVFCAVAHRNPYPTESFDEAAWNQMVLKALFIGAPLWPIQRLDGRANAPLARMLCDYAHERWAAGRPVSPELWRCVGPHADARALEDLEKVLRTGDETERGAAALALGDCPAPEAARLLASASGLTAGGADARLSWDDIKPT